jgi:hypothetical protein
LFITKEEPKLNELNKYKNYKYNENENENEIQPILVKKKHFFLKKKKFETNEETLDFEKKFEKEIIGKYVSIIFLNSHYKNEDGNEYIDVSKVGFIGTDFEINEEFNKLNLKEEDSNENKKEEFEEDEEDEIKEIYELKIPKIKKVTYLTETTIQKFENQTKIILFSKDENLIKQYKKTIYQIELKEEDQEKYLYTNPEGYGRILKSKHKIQEYTTDFIVIESENKKIYIFEYEKTELLKKIQLFKEGKLTEYLYSEKRPINDLYENNENIIKIVGSSIEEIFQKKDDETVMILLINNYVPNWYSKLSNLISQEKIIQEKKEKKIKICYLNNELNNVEEIIKNEKLKIDQINIKKGKEMKYIKLEIENHQIKNLSEIYQTIIKITDTITNEKEMISKTKDIELFQTIESKLTKCEILILKFTEDMKLIYEKINENEVVLNKLNNKKLKFDKIYFDFVNEFEFVLSRVVGYNSDELEKKINSLNYFFKKLSLFYYDNDFISFLKN